MDLVEILAKYIVMDNANCSKNDDVYKDDGNDDDDGDRCNPFTAD